MHVVSANSASGPSLSLILVLVSFLFLRIIGGDSSPNCGLLTHENIRFEVRTKDLQVMGDIIQRKTKIIYSADVNYF